MCAVDTVENYFYLIIIIKFSEIDIIIGGNK